MDKDERLEIGDVVRLNSGGIDMTVNSIEGDLIECAWIDEHKSQRYHEFKKVMLTFIRRANGQFS